jgi:hypothetical protein
MCVVCAVREKIRLQAATLAYHLLDYLVVEPLINGSSLG